MNISKKMKRGTIRYLFLCLAVVVTLLSQMPVLHEISSYSLIYTILWIFLFGMSLFSKARITFNLELVKVLLLVVVWAMMMMFGMIFASKTYMSNETTTLLLSVFVCTTGYLNRDVMTEGRLRFLLKIYILCVLIIAISVYQTYFLDGFTWDYDMKNSFAPILLITIILLLYYKWKNESKIIIFVRYIIAAALLVFIFLMRSRATIICVFVAFVLSVLHTQIKLRYKILIITLCVSFAITILLNDSVYDLIINEIFFASRDTYDLNTISSGRMDDIVNYYPQFLENVLFGIGAMYLDCFFVLSIYQYGILGGILVIAIALSPLLWVKKHKKEVPIYFEIIVVCFTINGLFEGLTPIGPGVKCMLLWLIYGIYLVNGSDLQAHNGG